MPQVEYTTTMGLPKEAIWDFVKDMNNWAPFLTGYQSHEIVNDTDSVWTLKGDVGILVRQVRLQVHITEWNGPSRVAFEMKGLNEEVDGGGLFEMDDLAPGETVPKREEPSAGASTSALAKVEAPPKSGLVKRMIEAIFRFFFRLVHGKGPERAALPAASATGPRARLKFTLRMDAGGPTGPLVNAMLGPALLPAAEDLGNKIAAHLEKAHGQTSGASARPAAQAATAAE